VTVAISQVLKSCFELTAQNLRIPYKDPEFFKYAILRDWAFSFFQASGSKA